MGVRMPYRQVLSWMDGRATITLTSIQINAPVDNSKFGKPAPAVLSSLVVKQGECRATSIAAELYRAFSGGIIRACSRLLRRLKNEIIPYYTRLLPHWLSRHLPAWPGARSCAPAAGKLSIRPKGQSRSRPSITLPFSIEFPGTQNLHRPGQAGRPSMTCRPLTSSSSRTFTATTLDPDAI